MSSESSPDGFSHVSFIESRGGSLGSQVIEVARRGGRFWIFPDPGHEELELTPAAASALLGHLEHFLRGVSPAP